MEKNKKDSFKYKKTVNIAIIGKYVNLKDAYKSLDEALTHGGIYNKIKVNLVRIESDKLRSNEIKIKIKKCFRNIDTWRIWQERNRRKNRRQLNMQDKKKYLF